MEPKRLELAAANAKLQEANTMLAAVQQKVGPLHSFSGLAPVDSIPACAACFNAHAQTNVCSLNRSLIGCSPSKHPKVAELNAKVQELEAQFNAAVDDKNAAIRESERCQLKLQLANRLISALASEGARARAWSFRCGQSQLPSCDRLVRDRTEHVDCKHRST